MEFDWDPLVKGEMTLTKHSVKVINRHIKELVVDPPKGMFICVDEKDSTLIHVVLIGPPGTPYNSGYFYVIVRCPEGYPIKPPKVRFMTTGPGKISFHRKILNNGKICLALLGTSEENSWSPDHDLVSVLLAIQGLLDKNPYLNETRPKTKDEVLKNDCYNNVIRHETMRLAVCDLLEKRFDDFKTFPQILRYVVDKLFQEAYETFRSCAMNSLHLNGGKMLDHNDRDIGTFSFDEIIQRLNEIKKSNDIQKRYLLLPMGIIPEMCRPSSSHKAGYLEETINLIKRQIFTVYNQPLDGIFIVPEEKDISLLHLLFVGPTDTPYQGGFFYFTLRFPPTFPVHPPSLLFLTTGQNKVRFHHKLTENGNVLLKMLEYNLDEEQGWSSAFSLSTILTTVKKIFNEKPYFDKPEYGLEWIVGDSDRYNDIIRHETIRVSVCIQILKGNSSYNAMPMCLRRIIETEVPKFFHYYISTVEVNQRFHGDPMIDPHFNERPSFQYGYLRNRLLYLKRVLQSRKIVFH